MGAPIIFPKVEDESEGTVDSKINYYEEPKDKSSNMRKEYMKKLKSHKVNRIINTA